MNAQFYFPPSTALFLEIVQWTLVGCAIVWVIARVMGVLHRRAYNLTYAESGRSKQVQPDFLKVDKHKRQDAIARGAQFDDALDRRGDGSAVPDSASSTSRPQLTQPRDATFFMRSVKYSR